MNNLFSVSPSQAKKFTELCMKAHLVPYLQSSPGMGKSSIVKQIAKEYSLELIDCRLSTMEPTDLNNQGFIQVTVYLKLLKQGNSLQVETKYNTWYINLNIK